MKKKEAATTYQQELSEVEKKRKRDKVRRTIVFGMFGLCLCVALLLLLISSIVMKFTKIEYPESTLSGEPQEEIETQAYDDLTQVISFGEYYMCIPNKEVVSTTDSALILKDSTHIYYFSKSEVTEESTLNNDLPFIINSIGANTYNPQFRDAGYINTLPAVYITGSAKARGNLYFVSYELFSSTEKMEILITAKNQGNLNLAKDMLDRMVNTLILKEEESSNDGPVAVEGNDGEEGEQPKVELSDDAPKSLSTDGTRSKYSYDKYYKSLYPRKSVTPDDGAYDEIEQTYFYNVQNVTTSLSYDRVYYEVTLSFLADEQDDAYFGSDEGDCYLIDINGFEIRPKLIDRSYAKTLTYVFECPNEYMDQVNDYTLIIADPLKRVSVVYFVVNEPKMSKYSPDYEALPVTDVVQEGSTVIEEAEIEGSED